MAERLPLPRYSDLPEVVLIHRESPADPMLLLQLPNEARTDAETHLINLERETDRAWIDGLKNARELTYLLPMEQHIAFWPQTGHTKVIADLDTPSFFQFAVADARTQAARPATEMMLQRRLVDRFPIMSRLRLALDSRVRKFGGQIMRRGR